jgi:hypothetical protein
VVIMVFLRLSRLGMGNCRRADFENVLKFLTLRSGWEGWMPSRYKQLSTQYTSFVSH